MPTSRVVEAAVSRKTDCEFPESGGNLLILTIRHFKIFKTFWVTISCMVKEVFPVWERLLMQYRVD